MSGKTKESETMVRSKTAVMLSFVVAATMTTLAQSVHLKYGANSEPNYVDGGLSLNVAGALAGLGNEDILVTLSATADVTSTCTNQGGNMAPGQNPAEVTVSGSQSIPASEIKNGNVSFNVTTVSPATPIACAPGCPNPNWRQDITDLSFTTGTITVEQPAGTTVLTVYCTFSAATANGAVSGDSVTCTSS
jgi:hypothetical protein